MPLYEYRCRTCGEEFEQIVSFSKADLLPSCPRCEGENTIKNISAAASFGSSPADRLPPPAVIAELASLLSWVMPIQPCAGISRRGNMQIRDATSKSKLVKRLKRIEGQVRGVQAMLEKNGIAVTSCSK